MLVTIHGPHLADSAFSFHVHDATAKAENEREVKMNGSKYFENVEISCREDIIDRLFPAEEFDREPDELPMYLADVYFGDSCRSLPLHAENPNEGEDPMEYTAEQKAQASEIHGRTKSKRQVAKEMGISPATVTKILAQAEADAETAAQMKRATTPRTARSRGNVPAKEDPEAMVPCRFCKDEKGNAVEHPATTAHWYVNTSTGGLHVLGRCKVAEKLYRNERKAIKEKALKDAAKVEAKATRESAKGNGQPEGERHLTAVA
jgi:hypothetical protein